MKPATPGHGRVVRRLHGGSQGRFGQRLEKKKRCTDAKCSTQELRLASEHLDPTPVQTSHRGRCRVKREVRSGWLGPDTSSNPQLEE
jgi:hypothetical protein